MAAALPTTRPSRVIVRAIAPVVDDGAFPAKATIDESVARRCRRVQRRTRPRRRGDALSHGPPQVDRGTDGLARERPLGGGVRARPSRSVAVPGGWLARPSGGVAAGHRQETRRRESTSRSSSKWDRACIDADARRRAGVRRSGAGHARTASDSMRCATRLRRGDVDGVFDAEGDAELPPLFWRTGRRTPDSMLAKPLDVCVDPVRARFSAWYEFFPRSTIGSDEGHATLADAIDSHRLRRRHGLRRPLHPARSPDRSSRIARAATTPSRRRPPTSAAHGRSAPPTVATRRSTPTSAPSTTSPRWRPPAVSGASSWPSTSPFSARPTTPG